MKFRPNFRFIFFLVHFPKLFPDHQIHVTKTFLRFDLYHPDIVFFLKVIGGGYIRLFLISQHRHHRYCKIKRTPKSIWSQRPMWPCKTFAFPFWTSECYTKISTFKFYAAELISTIWNDMFTALLYFQVILKSKNDYPISLFISIFICIEWLFASLADRRLDVATELRRQIR